MGAEVKGRNASVTVGIFWSLRYGPLQHSFPLCLVVQMPKIKPLPKVTRIAAELSSLSVTCPPPKPLMKLHERKLTERLWIMSSPSHSHSQSNTSSSWAGEAEKSNN